MNADRLITMANQIGDFFAAMPDRDEAINDIAGHLRRSWEPRMRRSLFAHLDQVGTDGLSPILRDVLTLKRQELEPPPV